MKPELSARSSEGIGARRRRFWSTDDKRRMIAESLKPGASVAMVAQRYGVNANLLFTWRRQEAVASGVAERVKLLPVTVAKAEAPTASPVAAPEPMGRMEIVLSGGERIIVGADVDATALARVVRTLTRR
jgi:transposase